MNGYKNAFRNTSVPTSLSHINNNADIHVEVLWLNSKEDCTAHPQGLMISVAVHLSRWVKTINKVHSHLPVALMTMSGSAKEVFHALRALEKKMLQKSK
jgi:hypothetical protein